MGKFIVKGGNILRGVVKVSGAKNSALPIICASILTSEKVRLLNIPTELEDVKVQLSMLEGAGANISIKVDTVSIDSASMTKNEVFMDSEKSIRTSLLMLGSLLGKFGRARVPLPGGDNIGDRRYDLHIYALERLGAKIKINNDGFLEAECNGLRGAEIEFPFRTTGGTENAMIAASLAMGTTIIKNAHTRPEVVDLANFLNSMGAKVIIRGSGYIEIEGVTELYGTNYSIIPDNVEALTFIIASALTGGDVEIKHCPINMLEIPMIYLRESGVNFYKDDDSLFVTRNNTVTSVDLSTGSYPGINSDFQPLFTVFATQAKGKSRITDIRFINRFEYAKELNKMGANIIIQGNTAIVEGERKLKGCQVNAQDIRGGAALIVAGLCADGETIIDNAYQINRGYEQIENKFIGLGAEFKNELDEA
ncbi:UDP-N-acetylglucosamine 1-carboxyvinyltransferase [Chloroflexota bacterium]